MEENILERILRERDEHFKMYSSVFRQGDRVLDIGIGPGYTAALIKDKVPDVRIEGLDVFDIRKVNIVPITLYTGTKMPWEDNTFDVSVIFYTIHHIRWPVVTLREASRITKRNVVVLEEYRTTETDLAVDYKQEDAVHRVLGIPGHIHNGYLSMKEFDEMAGACGLRTIEKIKLNSFSPRKVEKYLYIFEKI